MFDFLLQVRYAPENRKDLPKRCRNVADPMKFLLIKR